MEQRTNTSLSSTSLSLLDRIRCHQAEAWSRFVDLYGPLVYRWARQSQLQSSDAADVVQEVFRSVAANLENFRRDRPGDSFRVWLRTVTKNKVRDHFRQCSSQPVGVGGPDGDQSLEQSQMPQADIEDSQETIAASTQLVHRVLEMVQCEFTHKTWRAFWRVVVDEQKPSQVADELQMTIGAVYMAKSRVIRRLHDELDGLLD